MWRRGGRSSCCVWDVVVAVVKARDQQLDQAQVSWLSGTDRRRNGWEGKKHKLTLTPHISPFCCFAYLWPRDKLQQVSSASLAPFRDQLWLAGLTWLGAWKWSWHIVGSFGAAEVMFLWRMWRDSFPGYLVRLWMCRLLKPEQRDALKQHLTSVGSKLWGSTLTKSQVWHHPIRTSSYSVPNCHTLLNKVTPKKLLPSSQSGLQLWF